MSKGRLLGKLLGSSGSVPTEKLAGNITIEKLAGDIPITEKFATASLLPSTGNIGEQAFVEETNRLYIWNGSGWYNIALINATPTWDSNGQPASSYKLDADSPQTATTITLAASDPEGIPIQYSYVTSGQMDSMATISQDSSVFTITPKTAAQIPAGGTGSITFRATDGVNILPYVSSFTLNFISIIDDSKYTTLLATADGTSDNNNITDSSSNSHSITVNGDAQAGTFSPYRGGGYSTSFDSSNSSRLEIASMPAIGSGDCSIECWVNVSSLSQWHGIIKRGGNNQAGNFQFYVRNDTELYLNWSGSSAGTAITTSGANIQPNTWYWLQVIRSSGTVNIYVNGVSKASFSDSSNISSTTYYDIGGWTSYYSDALIRDLRVSTVARSSSTGPLDKLEVDSDTTFLSCHLPYMSYSTPSIVSNSYSNTPSSIAINSFSPYDYEEYSATDHGGSVYFDGNTDTIHTASTHNFANNGFSASLWYYPTLAQGALFASASNHIGTFHFSGSLSSSEIRYEYKNSSGSNTNLIGNNAAKPIYFSWNYLQIVQDSNGHIRIYSNGTQVGSTVTDAAMSGASGTAVTLGDWGSSGSSSGFQGYISDFNLTTETSPSTAVPIAPRSSTSNTKLLISGTDASIIDKSQRYNIDLGSTSIVGHSTTKWSGANSIFINSNSNNSDLITIPAGVLDASKPFTIEMWLKTLSGAVSGFWSIYQDASNEMRLKMRGDDRLEFYHRGSGAAAQEIMDATNTYLLNNTDFYHVAITRDANAVFYLHQNGIKLGNFTANGNYDSSAVEFKIGTSGTGSLRYMQGYMQDIRITQGLARYTAADETSNIPTEPLEG